MARSLYAARRRRASSAGRKARRRSIALVATRSRLARPGPRTLAPVETAGCATRA
jgi:hypothetical protein